MDAAVAAAASLMPVASAALSQGRRSAFWWKFRPLWHFRRFSETLTTIIIIIIIIVIAIVNIIIIIVIIIIIIK